MIVFKEFECSDLLDLNMVNLDGVTTTFSLNFYLDYFYKYNCIGVYSDIPLGYIFGSHGVYKDTTEKYSHITALSISPLTRRYSLGCTLMNIFEIDAEVNKSVFIDLFVRVSNLVAIQFYKRNNYATHNIIENYYSDPVEDALDMRKYLREKS
ncbi:N-terminal acetyltransferase B complex catalytic subunit [Nematocida sp. AWRm80]|nr:N-terminal acetyltransferase B complex catalytic subunit [Nematocida sp. AWRm80]